MRTPSVRGLLVLLVGNGLLLAGDGGLARVTGALMLLFLPGLLWTGRLFPTLDRLTGWVVGLGLSYSLALALGLCLHYLPGPIPLWAELAGLDILAAIPLLAWGRGPKPSPSQGHRPRLAGWRLLAGGLALVLLLGAIFRLVNLGYSEFQGDEALATISAAEALEGHPDALFLRGKGPGEVLLPMLLWRLTGTLNEAIARLPFAIAGLLMILTIYLLGRRLLPDEDHPYASHAALAAACLVALNGFMIGFSRIVQYQALVVWMSALALLCAWEWRARSQPYATRWAALTGVFLGAGLLAHYDAILVVPAIAYLQLSHIRLAYRARNRHTSQPTSDLRPTIFNILVATGCLLLVSGLFYAPYLLDPQAARTGGYLGDRIGSALLKNNLASFLHFNSFYTSFYYLLLTGLLVAGTLAWAVRDTPGLRRIPGSRYVLPALAMLVAIGLALRPDVLSLNSLDLAALPFALLLLGAFLSASLTTGQRAVVAWLAVPFLGYNFAVALPLTHIYSIVPAWALLAGLAAAKLVHLKARVPQPRSGTSLRPLLLSPYSLLLFSVYLGLAALFAGYVYATYLRHSSEVWQDWPDARPALYWSPYAELPPTGFFGFPHRAGWKVVGALYAGGSLKGDYGSNEEPDVTTWYTRRAPRACDSQPEYYLIADDLVDPWPVDREQIQANYTVIGQVRLPNGKGLTMYQARPVTGDLGYVQDDHLNDAYDRTATPAAFARSARGSQPAHANLGGLVRLVGYDLDTSRAWPDGRLSVTLYWQAQKPISADYHVFVHLEGTQANGTRPGIWGQADGRPVCWSYPTFDWRPGQIIADQYAIHIQPDTPPGEYDILAGMYSPDTGKRLDVLDESGMPIRDFVKLATVSVQAP
jgi:hypothetical protein